jgi:geranylgeranyl pyrophosphate synthase
MALGGNQELVTDIAAAWALVYSALYFLDKVEDQETGHEIFSLFQVGEVTNVTLELIVCAEELLNSLDDNAEIKFETAHLIRKGFNRALLLIGAGQHLDLSGAVPSVSEYWRIAENKSGEFFACACFMGARIATDNLLQVENITNYGKYLGLLIQIADDRDDLKKEMYGEGTSPKLRSNLACSYAVEVLPASQREELIRLINLPAQNLSTATRTRDIVISAGALVYLTMEMEKQRALAQAALQGMRLDSPTGQVLLGYLEQFGLK